MEANLKDNLSRYELIEKEVFNSYSNAHLFFYTYINQELHLLLLSNESNGYIHSEVFTELIPSDNVPPYAISRILMTKYRSLFSNKNLNKIREGEEITQNDLLPNDSMHPYELWLNDNFFEWLNNLTEKPIIQYDSISGTILYFVEFPNINIDRLNLNLKKINYPFSLSYFKYSINPILTDNYKILNKTIEFMKHFDFDEFIKTSKYNIENDILDYYIILGIKPKNEIKKDIVGFFHSPALFQGLYRRNNEKFIYFATEHELPDSNLLNKCKRIIIPGSTFSTNNDYKFIKDAEVWLKDIYLNPEYKHIKILGLCFGMQIMMQSLGSEVKKMNSEFIRFPEKLKIHKDFWNLEFVKSSKVKQSDYFVVPQAHGDEVVNIPTDVAIKNYGESESCKNEILVSDDERLFLIQGHPEYKPQFNLSKMGPVMVKRMGLEITHENIMEASENLMKSYSARQINDYELRRLCFAFLKH